MIDFKICRGCEHCVWHPPKEDVDGKVVVRPSVYCRLSGDVLLMNSNPPEECPNSFEHVVLMQRVPRKFANRMSGGKNIHEAQVHS